MFEELGMFSTSCLGSLTETSLCHLQTFSFKFGYHEKKLTLQFCILDQKSYNLVHLPQRDMDKVLWGILDKLLSPFENIFFSIHSPPLKSLPFHTMLLSIESIGLRNLALSLTLARMFN
jgi:hypothetical protein